MSKFFNSQQTTKEKLISSMLAETGWKTIDPNSVSIIKDNTGSPVGVYTTGVSDKGNPIMGYVYVLPEHRNKGYATRVAQEFKLKHPNMEWRSAKDNSTSQHIANKLNLKNIGTEKGELIFKGASLVSRLNEFAPGIPQKGSKIALPTSQKLQQWDFVVQEHYANRKGYHQDWRLAPPGGVGYSWVVNEVPTPGNRAHAIRVDDHTKDYFDFTGEIKSGYGAGTVKQLYRGKVDVIDAKPNKITFYWYGNSGTEVNKFTLIDVYGSDKWLLLNHTDTVALKRQRDIKPLKYKDKSGGNYVKQTDDFETPKIDGASSVVVLQGGKIPVVFSKRVSSKTGLQIEYTPKIPKLLESRVPENFGTTVLRAEVFAVDKNGRELQNSQLGGILNSSVQKSRATQKMSGTPLRLAGYDVVKYKGKNVDKLPIDEKYKIIQEISEKFPVIENPFKVNQIVPFNEGKVIWRNGIPIKVKDKKDFDVYVREIYLNIKNSRAGGIKYSHSPFGKIVGNVGTGFKHDELRDMMKNPDKYIGRVAKVNAQDKYETGALRAPAFKGWHLEK